MSACFGLIFQRRSVISKRLKVFVIIVEELKERRTIKLLLTLKPTKSELLTTRPPQSSMATDYSTSTTSVISLKTMDILIKW